MLYYYIYETYVYHESLFKGMHVTWSTTTTKNIKSILSYSTKWFYRHRVNSDLQELEGRLEAYVGSSKGVISSWNNKQNVLGSTVSMLVLQYLGTCEK